MEPEKVAVKVRAERSTESEVIAEIHKRAASAAYAHRFPDQPFPRDESVERWRSYHDQVLVVKQEGTIIGFAAFDQVELHALYVLHQYQGQGIGRQLLEAAGTVERLWLLEESYLARNIYEVCGWRVDGEKRHAYGIVEVLYRRQSHTQLLSGARVRSQFCTLARSRPVC